MQFYRDCSLIKLKFHFNNLGNKYFIKNNINY